MQISPEAFASLIGGVLAAASGFIVVWRQNSHERAEKRQLLKNRLRYVLTRIGGLGVVMGSMNRPYQLRRDMFEEVLDLRGLFERVSDYGMYLKSTAFDVRVTTFIMEAGITARVVLTDAAEKTRLEYEAGSGLVTVAGVLKTRLEESMNRVKAWKSEADALLRELDEQ